MSQVELAPNAATLIDRFSLAGWDASARQERLVYGTLERDGQAIRQNRLLLARYRDIRWPNPKIDIVRQGNHAVLFSDVFAWGVCIDPTGETDLPDDLFDLLPGVPWSFLWPERRPLPTVARTANYRPPD